MSTIQGINQSNLLALADQVVESVSPSLKYYPEPRDTKEVKDETLIEGPFDYQEAVAVEKNRVTAASNCNSMVPIGPWRCLPMITSALPRILSVSASH
jgi:hypothetical protein